VGVDRPADIVTGAGPGGGPHVKVFDGASVAAGTPEVLQSFYAYGPAFAGGVFVAVGDVNGDGEAEVITGAGAGGTPHVRVIDGQTGQDVPFVGHPDLTGGFHAYSPAFSGGVAVGWAGGALVTGAGPGGGPHVRAFDPLTLSVLDSFYAYDPTFTGGVFVGGV
jgi:hypothetical protein